MFQNKEKSISLKTMEDGQVMLYSVIFNFLHSIFFHFDFCQWHCVMVFYHLSLVNSKEAKITELSFTLCYSRVQLMVKKLRFHSLG
jgi:hypothetical protein